ncbi:Type I restriction-modification system, specificity subunit S [Streptococcus oralis]|uniref:Type I restriction-modification system, specificity subunit S n=1 Tax=Streptococcus oralis TaxID=1303 RepID=A0A139NUY6_STROR|nr:restriction endonuclease subunit S [Streptococcus oralis]KXT79839.1 Type I restriction-modification system, specificity subunit S [Streptococcus oralis]
MKNIPKLRFPEFKDTEPWEQRRLGEVKDVRDGTHDSPKYIETGFPLITSKNLTSEGLDFSDISYISEDDYNKINERSKVEIGDIIFGMIGTIGNPVLVDKDRFAIKNVALLKNNGSIRNQFLIQILQSSIFEKYIRKENAGGTQKFLGLSQIRNFCLLVPSLPDAGTDWRILPNPRRDHR